MISQAAAKGVRMKSYTVINPSPSVPLVANLPHGSPRIPKEVLSQFIIPESELNEQSRKLTDWFIDELYTPIFAAGGCGVRNEVSRFVADPERLEDDAQECMAPRGMGVIYTHGCERQPIRRSLSDSERAALLAKYYRPYHDQLLSLITKCLNRFNTCTIIDCHSYQEHPLPYEIDPHAERYDITLGTDPHHTPAWIISTVKQISRSHGLSCGLNRPFSGTYVPLSYYKDPRIHAFMLEVKRSTYMDERTTAPHDGFGRVQAAVQEIVSAILAGTYTKASSDHRPALNSSTPRFIAASEASEALCR
jgi:N-formylglutamate amidohydrolase